MDEELHKNKKKSDAKTQQIVKLTVESPHCQLNELWLKLWLRSHQLAQAISYSFKSVVVRTRSDKWKVIFDLRLPWDVEASTPHSLWINPTLLKVSLVVGAHVSSE